MLPAEPEVLVARQAFTDAQATLGQAARVGSRSTNFVNLGWYGSRISDERGSFALVSPNGPLAGLVGEVVRLVYEPPTEAGTKTIVAYVAETATIAYDIGVTRRLFAALELLSVTTIPVLYEIIA